MYNEFRQEMIFKMGEAGLDTDTIRTVLDQMDMLSVKYSISKACTDIAIRENEIEKYAKMYLICKQLEGCGEKTIEAYKGHILLFARQNVVPLDQIDTNTIRRYLLVYKTERDISDRSLNAVHGALKRFFTWMHGEGYIAKNPFTNISKIKFKVKQKPALTQTELEHLRECCDDDRERAMVETLYSTGCRISEMLNIKIKDVKWDLPQPECKVIGKGNKEGTVYFSPRSVSVLRKYLKNRRNESEYLFCNDRGGGQMSKENAEKIFRSLRERSGLQDKRLTPHTMRHTMGTAAVQVAPIEIVRDLLRHSDINTTMIYAETSKEEAKRYHQKVIL